MNTAHDLYLKGKSLLSGFEDPELEARLLIYKALSVSSEDFFRHPKRCVSPEKEQIYLVMLEKRLSGIPLAYITGFREFWSTQFSVKPGVLIPRPETEHIVEKVLERVDSKTPTIVDIGTGSGCIAVTLGKEIPLAQIYATDISSEALEIAAGNAKTQGLSNISFVQGELFQPLGELNLQGKCDYILSNPPYVSSGDWETLAREIREHEPKEALVAGETGLEVIERLIKGAPEYLKPGTPEDPESGGFLIFEIGYGQHDAVMRLFDQVYVGSDRRVDRSVGSDRWADRPVVSDHRTHHSVGSDRWADRPVVPDHRADQFYWNNVTCHPDLAGIPRVFMAQSS